ncbi:hypothetical protein E2C01_072898 [Portunus trituberculatus]|uniref:Uncharacterized protein n=1 Tax=Portunus trituberculatus TaxID=210409 RepID=A0A5B7I3S2_PORTR|nr:hypothetical protein [Portunus trituberculatus]
MPALPPCLRTFYTLLYSQPASLYPPGRPLLSFGSPPTMRLRYHEALLLALTPPFLRL